MRTVTTISDLRATLRPARRAGSRIGLVPTMGALHAGHLSLMQRARTECDLVVVSLFVNPAQFNDAGDLAAYPRGLAADAELAAAVGVDVLFAPDRDEVYPAGFATHVVVDGVTERLEGASRGKSHFTGVTTVVAKLLGMAGPEIAYFGQKDAQQVAVVRRMVADLNLPVRIAVCPTVRDHDGLALSSRNAHLSEAERVTARALPHALELTAAAIHDGERDPALATAAGREALTAAGAELEYLELVDPADLEPVGAVDGPVLAVAAAYVGATRLIDNVLIEPVGTPAAIGPAATRPGRS